MKKGMFMFIICSFCSSVSAFGQQSALIAQQWNVLEFRTIIGQQDFLDCRTYTYMLGNDTIINDTHYQIISRFHACDGLTNASSTENLEVVGAIRQTEHQVYIYHNNSEKLLYDFDVSVGDQRPIFAGMNGMDETYTNVVTDVQYLEDGRRVISVDISVNVDIHHTTWIEGIGTVSGILYYDPDLAGGYSTHLLCAYNDSELIYSTQDAYFQPFGCCYNKDDTANSMIYQHNGVQKKIQNERLVIIYNDNAYDVLGRKL